MNRIISIATVLAIAASAQAAPSQTVARTPVPGDVAGAPPAGFEPALKQAIAAVSQDVFRDSTNPNIRNRAYSVELMREQVQRNLARARSSLSHDKIAVQLPGLRERVLEETMGFLMDLSPEVNRLARESQSTEEFASKLNGISRHIGAWAGSDSAAMPQPVQTASLEVQAGKLPPTEDNIEGPFYRPKAPLANTLVPPGAQGQLLRISGQVVDTDGQPIPLALVDVWQADPAGNYDIADPKDRDNPNIPYRFRARMRANRFEGRYSFVTLLPGQYEIGEGKWRPKHIHFKVSAQGFKSLTTQLYFEGDKYNATDPWWKASTTIAIHQGEGLEVGTFNIVLPPTSKGR